MASTANNDLYTGLRDMAVITAGAAALSTPFAATTAYAIMGGASAAAAGAIFGSVATVMCGTMFTVSLIVMAYFTEKSCQMCMLYQLLLFLLYWHLLADGLLAQLLASH